MDWGRKGSIIIFLSSTGGLCAIICLCAALCSKVETCPSRITTLNPMPHHPKAICGVLDDVFVLLMQNCPFDMPIRWAVPSCISATTSLPSPSVLLFCVSRPILFPALAGRPSPFTHAAPSPYATNWINDMILIEFYTKLGGSFLPSTFRLF